MVLKSARTGPDAAGRGAGERRNRAGCGRGANDPVTEVPSMALKNARTGPDAADGTQKE